MHGGRFMQTMFQFSSSPQAVSGGRRAGKTQQLYRSDDRKMARDLHVTMTATLQKVGATTKKTQAEWLRNANPNTDEDVRSLLRQALRNPVDISTRLVEQRKQPQLIVTECQTQGLFSRPESPPYIPKKTGVDMSTQIEAEDGLFDFDAEVEPILDMIVSKTLEQSLVEVNHEHELVHLNKVKGHYFSAKKKARVAEQTFEAVQVERRRTREKLKATKLARLKCEFTICEKAAAAVVFAREIGNDLQATVFEKLDGTVTFPDERHDAIVNDFLPWVEEQVAAATELRAAMGLFTDELIQTALYKRREAALELRASIQARKDAEAAAIIAATQAAEEAVRRAEEENTFVKIFLRGPEVLGEGHSVGPIKLRLDDTIAAAEDKIQDWLVDNVIEVRRPERGFLELALSFRNEADDKTNPLADSEQTLEFLNLFHQESAVAMEEEWGNKGE